MAEPDMPLQSAGEAGDFVRLFAADPVAALPHWIAAFATACAARNGLTCIALVDAPLSLPPGTERVIERMRAAARAVTDSGVDEGLEAILLGTPGCTAPLFDALCATGVDAANADGHREATEHAVAATLLEASGLVAPAAVAWMESGRRLADIGAPFLEAATDALSRAADLGPRAPAYWQLSDAWRLRSYTSTPPYVDGDALTRSLAAWQRGIALGTPDRRSSWVYVARALASEQAARLHEADRLAHWWDAVGFIERALLLDDQDVLRWAYAGRWHRYVENEHTALHATARALEQDATDPVALEERAATLATSGAYEEAARLAEERLALDPTNQWALSTKAYGLLRQGQHAEALAVIDAVITAEPDSVWNLDLRASCCEKLGDIGGTQQAYERIWNLGINAPLIATDDRRTWAYAGYRLGHIDEAIATFDELARDSLAKDDAWRLLGLCHIVRGDLAAGEALVLRGLVRATVHELDDFVNLECPPTNRTAADERSDTLGRLHTTALALLAERRRSTGDDVRAAAEEELSAAAAKADRATEPSSAAQDGSRMSLARVQLDGARWDDAAATYAALVATTRVPEADAGLDRALAGWRDDAMSQLARGEHDAALLALRGRVEIARERSRGTRLTDAYRDLAGALWRVGDDDGARDTLQAARAVAPPDDAELRRTLLAEMGVLAADITATARCFAEAAAACPDNPLDTGAALADACRRMLRNTEDFWRVDDSWAALALSERANAFVRDVVPHVRHALLPFLDAQFHLGEHRDESSAVPGRTPIRLEVGVLVRPLVDPSVDRGEFIERAIPAMLDTIRAATGVPRLPGIQVRPVAPEPEGYTILLHEATVARGRVQVGARFCLEAPADDEAPSTPSLRTGVSGVWYPASRLQSETAFMLNHLETMVRRHLPDLFGIGDTRLFLERVLPSDTAAPLAAALLDRSALIALTTILRALLAEGVPISDWTAIAAALERTGLASVDAAVQVVRAALKDTLPGNAPGTSYVVLPSSWNDLGDSDDAVVSVTPQDAHDRIRKVREWLADKGGPVALVVGAAAARPRVRRLIAYEFPDVAVLTRDEVADTGALVDADASAAAEGRVTA